MFRDYNLTTPATKRSWPQKSMRAPRQKPATTESRGESERERKGFRTGLGGRGERGRRQSAPVEDRGGLFSENIRDQLLEREKRMLRMSASTVRESVRNIFRNETGHEAHPPLEE